MPADPIPDFVGVGALKAGTTYLDAMLRGHPQLSLPTHLKEVNFFNRHYERGAAWYASQFAGPDGRRRGEISPQYLFDSDCPQRLHEANPDVRILLNVRSPVARTFSQYRHWVRETGYRGGFETFLAEHPGAAERSRYWSLLQRYRAVFADEQIRIVVFEDLIDDPRAGLRAVYAFLGVDVDYVPDTIETPANVSGTPRFPHAYVAAKWVTQRLLDHGAFRTVERVKDSGFGRMLRGGRGADHAPRLPDATAARLSDGFHDEVAALGRHLDRDLCSLWKV